MGICSCSAIVFTASRNFSVTCPSTTGEGIGSPSCSLMKVTSTERLSKAAMTENAIAKQIVDAAFRIHTTLGAGLLESVYHAVLAYEFAQRGLRTVSQQPIPVVYGTIRIDIGFRADLIVEDRVVVEIKSVEVVAPVHKKQLLTNLRLAEKRLGLLINFNAVLIKDGISRIVNGLQEESHASRKDAKKTCDTTGCHALSV